MLGRTHRSLSLASRPQPTARLPLVPRAILAATPVQEGGKKDKKPKPAKDALFLLQWHGATVDTTPEALTKELKTLEKVSKDAVWFTVKEAEQGKQHVLVVTNDRKKAKKYALSELTGDQASIQLEGLPAPVEIPVASIKAQLQKAMMEDDSSDSSSDEDEPRMDKKSKGMKGSMIPVPETVPENPAAADQAASLLGLTTNKEGRKKLKDAVKEVVAGTGPAALPQPTLDMGKCEEDTSSSSSSGSSSESDEECGDKPPKMGKVDMPGDKQMDAGSSESESSGSESDMDEKECMKKGM